MKIKKRYFKNDLDDLSKEYLSIPHAVDKNFERKGKELQFLIEFFINRKEECFPFESIKVYKVLEDIEKLIKDNKDRI